MNTIEHARRSLIQKVRMELYAQAQGILTEEVPFVLLGYDRAQLSIKPWMQRYPVSALAGPSWKDVVLEPH